MRKGTLRIRLVVRFGLGLIETSSLFTLSGPTETLLRPDVRA